MVKLSLNTRDRFTVANLISQKPQGNRLEMTLLYDLMRKVEFSPKEIEENEIREEGNGVFVKRDFEIEVELSEQQVALVAELANIASGKNELWLQEIPTVNKFDNLLNR